MDSSIEKLALAFKLNEIGNNIVFLEETESTNLAALSFQSRGDCHGTVIVAEKQNAGRGRQGRQWFSLRGKGLFFTIILTSKQFSNKYIPLLSFISALSIYETLKEFGCGNVDIKWPNDLLLDGKKISGILGEMKTGASGIERIALGMSVNLAHTKEDFPSDLTDSATSILLSSGDEPDEEEVLHHLLTQHNHWLNTLNGGGAKALIEAVEKRSTWAYGKEISFISSKGEEKSGITRGFHLSGSLKVELPSGEKVLIHAGDVHLKK